MRYKKRNNLNLIYCILLGVSLVAIIVVACICLIKEVKDKNQVPNQTSGAQSLETTAPYDEGQTNASTEVNGGFVPNLPTETTSVQTVQEHDINGDGTAENVQVSIDYGLSKSVINVDGLGVLEVMLEPIGVNAMQHFTVVGINLKNDKRLAAIEYTYINGGIGLVKVHVWKYANNTFVKTSEILYSGLIGNQGFMDAGIIENRVPEDTFGYNAEQDKNNYIYERSRVIADMKDLGIKLPFETAGEYTIGYDRNVTFFYDADVQ